MIVKPLANYTKPDTNIILAKTKSQKSTKNDITSSTKKILNLIEFIKEKNKFFIRNAFDANGTREFLASKEVAMREIKISDEIIEGNQKKVKFNNNNINENENNKNNKNKNSTKTATGKATVSPRKSRKCHKIKSTIQLIPQENIIEHKRTKKSKKSRKSKSKINNSFDNDKIVIFDKEDSDSIHNNIYKFFIENADESEENFNKKLKKELKKVEKKQNKEKESTKKVKIRRKSISRKDLDYKRPSRMNSTKDKNREIKSVFMFSEINKNLMKNADIELSSIGEEKKNDKNLNELNNKKIYGTIQINNKKIKDKIDKNTNSEKDNIIVGKEDEHSDKDSIISILSDLI